MIQKQKRRQCTYSSWLLDTAVNHFTPRHVVTIQFPDNHGHIVLHSPPIGPTPQAISFYMHYLLLLPMIGESRLIWGGFF